MEFDKIHQKFINYTDEQVLNFANCGFEFEFYSKNNKSKENVAKELQTLLSREIEVADGYHTTVEVNQHKYKLEADRSGGLDMIELITGAMPYYLAKEQLKLILKYLQANAVTNNKCSIHINLSFNVNSFLPNFISKLNKLKFILDFNEKKIYKYFPSRENNVYAKTIKHIYPINKSYDAFPNKTIKIENIVLPNTKYFGVNFLKVIKEYIEFRYLGGENYQFKENEIFEMLDYFILQLFDSCNERKFSEKHNEKLKETLKNYIEILNACSSLENFQEYTKDIVIQVDLISDKKYIKSKFPLFQNDLYHILVEGKLKSGIVNYNSDNSRVEVKNGKMPYCFYLKNLDLINCEIYGIIMNCNVLKSKISGSELIESNIYKTNIENSKITDCFIDKNSEASECYIQGILGIFNGIMTGGVFREGSIFKNARISNTTKIIDMNQVF